MIELRRVKHEPSGFIKLQQRIMKHYVAKDHHMDNHGVVTVELHEFTGDPLWSEWTDIPLVTEGTPVVNGT